MATGKRYRDFVSGVLPAALTLAMVVNSIGISFQHGTHTKWQLVANDGTGAPRPIDRGAGFAIATNGAD